MSPEKKINQIEEYIKVLSKSVEDLTFRLEMLEKKLKS